MGFCHNHNRFLHNLFLLCLHYNCLVLGCILRENGYSYEIYKRLTEYSVGSLSIALQNLDFFVDSEIKEALKNTKGDPTKIIDRIDNEEAGAMRHLISALKHLRNEAIPYLAQILRKEEVNEEIKFQILLEFPSIIKSLIKNLDHEDLELKLEAIEILGIMKNEEITDALLEILTKSDIEIRCAIIHSLRRQKYPKTIEALLRLLEDEVKEPQTQLVIIRNIKLDDFYKSRSELKILNPAAQIVDSLRSLPDSRIIHPLTELITKNELTFKEERLWALTLGVSEEEVSSEIRILKQNDYNLNVDEVRKSLRNLGLKGEPPILWIATKSVDLIERSYDEVSKWRLFYALRDYCTYPYREILRCEHQIESWNDLNEVWIWDILMDIIWVLQEIGTKEAEKSLLRILDVKLEEHESFSSNPDKVESRTAKRLRYFSIFVTIESLYEIGNKNGIEILEDLLRNEVEMIFAREIEKEIEKLQLKMNKAKSIGKYQGKSEVQIIFDLIQDEARKEDSGEASIEKIKEKSYSIGIEKNVLTRLIKQLKRDGVIYYPKEGYVKIF